MIEIQELYKYYGDRRVVGPLTTEIAKGEIIGLLGLNGAGKTTTLRILACDLLPTSGTVRVGGHDVVAAPDEVRARVGYLPDRPPLYDDMTVDEYLTFAARLRRVRPAEVQRRVDDSVDVTELGEVRRQMIGTLSHGYRQRVGIAQAVVHRPEFVVLDEPISGLDPVQIVEMRKLVRSLGGDHTVVVSSHILSEISETCDRIFVIDAGRVAWSGTEKELSAQSEQGMRVEVTTRGTSEERLHEALRSVAGVERVERVEPSEPGDAVITARVSAASDVRDAICRALVSREMPLLQLVRHRRLENMFLDLLSSSDDTSRRRARRPRPSQPDVLGSTPPPEPVQPNARSKEEG